MLWQAAGAASAALALVAQGTSGAAMPATGACSQRSHPGCPGRDTAAVGFGLQPPRDREARGNADRERQKSVVWETEAASSAARPHGAAWTSGRATPVGSYVMRLTIARPGAQRRPCSAGGGRASVHRQQAAVVRVLGVEAAFLRRSYTPGEPMELRHPRRRGRR